MVDVFISYSKNDRERVSQLARAIEHEGYAVWWDAELPLHQSYGDVITEKIERARAAIVVWSPDAAASEWVRAEADTARNQKKLIQTALGDMIPPMPFNQVQCANLKDWDGDPDSDHDGWRKVRESLIALCGERERGADSKAAAGAAAGGAAGETSQVEPQAAAELAQPATTGPATDPSVGPEPAAEPQPSVPVAEGKSPSTPVLVGAGVGILVLLAGGMYALSSSSGGDGGDDAEIAYSDDEVIAADDPLAGKPGGEDFAANQPPPVAVPQPSDNSAQGGADEFNRDVNLVNQTGETIFYLYWSSVDDPNWGEDRLGADVFPAGNTWQVTADDGSGACYYDFMAETANGRQIERRNVDVCSVWNINFD